MTHTRRDFYTALSQQKTAAARDLLAMGAGVLGNLGLATRGAFNSARQMAARGTMPLSSAYTLGRGDGFGEYTRRIDAGEARFAPLHRGYLTEATAPIRETLQLRGTFADESDEDEVKQRLFNMLRAEGHEPETAMRALELPRAAGTLGGNPVRIVPTGGARNDIPDIQLTGRDGVPSLVTSRNMPTLLHELGHHATLAGSTRLTRMRDFVRDRVPDNSLSRALVAKPLRLASEVAAQNWAEERMTDPAYRAAHNPMDRPPRLPLNASMSMADSGRAALGRLVRGDLQGARGHAGQLLEASAPLSTYADDVLGGFNRTLGAAAGAAIGGLQSRLRRDRNG